MKIERKILLISFSLGIFVWVADALMDYFLFYEGTFTELLITNIPDQELYNRLLLLLCLVVLGSICMVFISEQKLAAEKLSISLSFQQQLLDTIPIPIFYKDDEYIYRGCNKSFEEFLGMSSKDIIGKSVFGLAPEHLAKIYHEKDSELINNPGVQVYEFEVKSKTRADNRQVIFHKATFSKNEGQIGGLIGAILDITERKKHEEQREKLISQLQEALDEVKLLSGFLPICASCKQIRDDRGYWNQIESYLSEHSDLEFSHSICPDCKEKLYPEFNTVKK